jgi:hypothetical protein
LTREATPYGFQYKNTGYEDHTHFFKTMAPEQRAGYEGWPDVKPAAPSNKNMDRHGKYIHMELGLPTDDEVRHLDHMFSQEQWRELTGSQDELYLIDSSLSQILPKMLRRGTCYRRFVINALGHTPLTEIHGVVRDPLRQSRSYSELRSPGWGEPTESDQLLPHGQVSLVHHWEETER